MAKSKFWWFTWFKYPENHEEYFQKIHESGKLQFCQYSVEKAPTTGNLHLQGHLELANASQAASYIQKMLPKSTHGICKGTTDQNDDYTSKSETHVSGPYVYGVKRELNQGHRSDIDTMCEKLEKGVPLRIVAKEHRSLYMRCGKMMKEYQQLQRPDDKVKFTIDMYNLPAQNLDKPLLICGKSRKGKSGFAKAHFTKPLYVKRKDDLKKFVEKGDYDGIVLDDFTFRSWTPEDILSLLEYDSTRSIDGRFHDAEIPADTKMIFTHQNDQIFMPYICSDPEQIVAIKSRYNVLRVDTSLIKGSTEAAADYSEAQPKRPSEADLYQKFSKYLKS